MDLIARIIAALWGHKTGILIGGAVGAGATILIGGDVAFGWFVFFTALGALVGAGVQYLVENWRTITS